MEPDNSYEVLVGSTRLELYKAIKDCAQSTTDADKLLALAQAYQTLTAIRL